MTVTDKVFAALLVAEVWCLVAIFWTILVGDRPGFREQRVNRVITLPIFALRWFFEAVSAHQ